MNELGIIDGIKIIDYKLNSDLRGYLYESYNKSKTINNIKFCQDNIVQSNYGVIRGMHYQLEPKAQSKLLTVIQGSIQDVVIDIRESSKTFGKHFSIVLDEESNQQLFIPKGFAHGFLTLSSRSIVQYKLDNFYSTKYQRSIAYDDPDLNINWKIDLNQVITSDKDSINSKFRDIDYFK